MIAFRAVLIGGAVLAMSAAPIAGLAYWLLLVQPFLP